MGNGLVLDVPFEVLFDVFTNGTNGPQWYESAVSTCSENDENRKGGKGKKKKGRKKQETKKGPTFAEALERFEYSACVMNEMLDWTSSFPNGKGGKGESFNFFNDHWIDGWAFEEYDNCLADYEPGVGSIEPRCLNEYEEEEQENIENATALEAKWRCATDTIFNSPVP